MALDGYIGTEQDQTEQQQQQGPYGFGVHTINCTYHPYGEFSLLDVEEIFQMKFGDMSSLDGFMDFNLGLWTNDLTTYVQYVQCLKIFVFENFDFNLGIYNRVCKIS